MENEAILKQCAHERDNVHKLKQLAVFQQQPDIKEAVEDATNFMKSAESTMQNTKKFDEMLRQQKSAYFSHNKAASFDRT